MFFTFVTAIIRTIFIVVIGLIPTMGIAHAYSVSDLLGDKFYLASERSDKGPMVRAGLDYSNPFGLYATTNAVFQNEGFVQNVSTGYRISLNALQLGASYNATQLQLDNHGQFIGASQLSASYSDYSYRYTMSENSSEQTHSVSHTLYGVTLQGKLIQTLDRTTANSTVITQKTNINARWNRGGLQYTRIESGDARTHDYLANRLWNSKLSSTWHYQNTGRYSFGETTLNVAAHKKLQLGFRIAQSTQNGHLDKRVHSISVNRRFKDTQVELMLSDASPRLEGSAFLINYRKQIVF